MTNPITEQVIRRIANEELLSSGVSLLAFREKLDLEVSMIKNDLKVFVTDMFESADFVNRLKKDIFRFVEQEVRSVLSEHELGEIIKEKIEAILHNKLDNIINKVVHEIVLTTNKKLTKDYEIAKELSYSIDATIKHALRDAPISYNSEAMIKEKIMGLLETVKVNNIKRLESKK